MLVLKSRIVAVVGKGSTICLSPHRIARLALVIALQACGSSSPAAPNRIDVAVLPPSNGSGIGHIFLIVMENREYGDVIGSSAAPYINHLASDYGLAQQSYGIGHPSLPNYLALLSGSTQGMTTDCEDCSFDAPNLLDQLEAHGRSWRSYQEDVPGPCFNAAGGVGLVDRLMGTGYVRRHNPFAYFKSIQGYPQRCGDVVPMTTFSSDLRSRAAPDFVWITPNFHHDMHDGSIAEGDAWLRTIVPEILASAAWKDRGLLIITWDEGTTSEGCCGSEGGGHVPTIVVASAGKRGFRSQLPISHYSVLHTIEDAWGLGLLGHAADQNTNTIFDFLT